MKLVYEKQPTREVQVGDQVQNNDADKFIVVFFRQPSKPSSEGKISVSPVGESNKKSEYYVSVFGMKWIDREDRPKPKVVRQRNHNEYFRTVSLGGRKSCPSCKAKLSEGQSIWSWGEYVNVKWRTIVHFCRNCFPHQVLFHLKSHTGDCGCKVTLVAYRGELPDWLKLE